MSAIVWTWIVLATMAAAGAGYVWAVWWQVRRADRGVRGAALGCALTMCFLIASSFAALHHGHTRIPTLWLLVVERSAWWPLVASLLVLADLYASDANTHRAITTILYRRWERLRARKG